MKTVIYCGHSFEEWSPKSEKEGIGGSEEAVINMAFELSKLGNEVTVYNRCGDDEGEYDGVKYENYEYFDDITADVVVFWRQPNYIWDLRDKYKAGQTFLWLHDTVPESELLKIKHFVDGVFVLSGFHASLYPNMRDKLIRTANGIKFEDTKVKRDPYKIVYGSSYDRGLKELLEMWPEIKAYEKEATLTVFYGMSMIQDENFKDEIKHLLNQEGITELGRISHKEVAEQFASAGVWCYPCWFPEISPLHGDTLVETLNGKHKIKDLVGKKDFYVYSCDSNGDLSVSNVNGVFKTRTNAPMVRLTFKPWTGRNAKETKTLTLTPDHEVMLRDGTYKPAGELSVGDRVKVFHRQSNDWGKGYDSIGVTDREKIPEHRFVANKFYSDVTGMDVDHIDDNTYNNNPENLKVSTRSSHWKDTWARKSEQERAEWAKGRTETLEKYHSQFTKDELSEVKRKAANTRWAKLSNHAVVKIETVENADAYCMEVEPDHNFVANGIFVHNCITAMKAQAYGAIPVITPTAALQETVRWGLTTREPRDHNGEMPWGTEMPTRLMDRYVNITKKALDPDYQYRFRQMMMSDARRFTWERVALSWDRLWKFGRSLKK